MKSIRKRIISILLITVMIICSACGRQQTVSKEEKNQKENGGGSKQVSTDLGTKTEVALGRFVEEDLTVPDDIVPYLEIQQLEDGTLQIVSVGEGDAILTYISTDNGSTWEKQDY